MISGTGQIKKDNHRIELYTRVEKSERKLISESIQIQKAVRGRDLTQIGT